MNSVIDHIKYFAKFPGNINYVLDAFSNKTSGLPEHLKAEYDNLKSEIENLQAKELIPELSGFHFAFEEENLKGAMSRMKDSGFFLLIEFPVIEASGEDIYSLWVREDVGIAVLHDFSARNFDKFEELIIMREAERIMNLIIDTMIKDSKKCPLMESLQPSIQKVPDKIAGCKGYMASFSLVRPWKDD